MFGLNINERQLALAREKTTALVIEYIVVAAVQIVIRQMRVTLRDADILVAR